MTGNNAGKNHVALTWVLIGVMNIISHSGKCWAADFRGWKHLILIRPVLKCETWTHAVPLV